MTLRPLLAAVALLAGVLAWRMLGQQTREAAVRYEYVYVEEWGGGETVHLCYVRPNGCEWRYVRISPYRDHLAATASATAQLGAQGWELVAAHPYPGESASGIRQTFRRIVTTNP